MRDVAETAETSQAAARAGGCAAAAGLGQGASATPACILFALAGLEYEAGFDALSYGLGLVAGLVLAAVLVGPPLRASGAATVAGFIGDRFGRPARVLAVVAVVLSAGLLLAAELLFAGGFARRFLGAPASAAIAVLIAAALTLAMARASWRVSIALAIVLAVGYLAPLALLGAGGFGWGYGAALPDIQRLETTILEAGLADLETFRPHVSAFLDIDAANFAAIIVSLAAGTPALAHVVARFADAGTIRDARLAGAWTTLFAALLVAAAPAYAALVKREIYAPIAQSTSLASLPPWIETLSRRDVVRIHGTSLAMLDDVARAMHDGATDSTAVAAHLRGRAATLAWSRLRAPVKDALVAAARAIPDAETARWDIYRSAVLPAAAEAAGNTSGLLTQGGLTIDAVGVMAAVPALTGAPLLTAGLLGAAVLAALLATTTALLTAIATTLARDARNAALSTRATQVVLLGSAVAAAGAAFALSAAEPLTLALAAFSIAASALCPALVLGLWWRRANVLGAVIAIAAGLAVCLTYEVGTRYFPVAFYETWPTLSAAGPTAVARFQRLEAVYASAPAGADKAAAQARLVSEAAGSGTARVGLANWFGIFPASAAVFALPVGILVMLVAGFLLPRRVAIGAP